MNDLPSPAGTDGSLDELRAMFQAEAAAKPPPSEMDWNEIKEILWEPEQDDLVVGVWEKNIVDSGGDYGAKYYVRLTRVVVVTAAKEQTGYPELLVRLSKKEFEDWEKVGCIPGERVGFFCNYAKYIVPKPGAKIDKPYTRRQYIVKTEETAPNLFKAIPLPSLEELAKPSGPTAETAPNDPDAV